MLAVYSKYQIFELISPSKQVKVTCAMEAMGDITASAEVSRVDVRGVEFDSRIQGGILVRNMSS